MTRLTDEVPMEIPVATILPMTGTTGQKFHGWIDIPQHLSSAIGSRPQTHVLNNPVKAPRLRGGASSTMYGGAAAASQLLESGHELVS